jgi:hypothetical protein
MDVATKVAPREQARLLTGGCDHVETAAELEERIAAKGRLTVKFGVDTRSCCTRCSSSSSSVIA